MCKYDGRQLDISANRTPLMTSESVANHGTSLYGHHDNRTTPGTAAAVYSENKRLLRGRGGGLGVLPVYDQRKLSLTAPACSLVS